MKPVRWTREHWDEQENEAPVGRVTHAPESGTRLRVEPARVLIAEDDEDLRRYLVMLFEACGYAVSEVASGSELVANLSNWILGEEADPKVDLLIADVRMPGFDGLRIVEGLCMAGWKLPTILVSATADLDVEERARACEHVSFMRKPLNFLSLEAHVREVLGESAPARMAG